MERLPGAVIFRDAAPYAVRGGLSCIGSASARPDAFEQPQACSGRGAPRE